jgi:ABC-type uncharacterized transport system substrate-binding protein
MFRFVTAVSRAVAASRSGPTSRASRAAAVLISLCASVAPALAHPHVFVGAKAEIVFNAEGKIVALRHAWTFDEMYSAFQTQGAAKDGKRATREDLAPLAKVQAEQLADFGYFTVAKASGKKQEFGAPSEVSLEEGEDKLVTLRFTLPLKEPASAAKAFTLQVYDPTYFVDFRFDDSNSVRMIGAPQGCSVSIVTPPPLLAEDAKKKEESFFSGLSPGAEFGLKLASRGVVACP